MSSVRSSKTVGDTIYNYTTLSGLVMRQTWGTADSPKSVISFVYDDAGQPYAMRYKQSGETSTSLYYYILNVQGDVVGLMNSAGTQVVQYSYDPWGKLLGTSIKVSQSNANYALYEAVAEANPLRYRGYYYDTETEFYYLQSRYYDPEIGRFINADTFATTDIDGLLSTNMFAYCENNPTNNSDPTGELLNAISGAVIGAVFGGISEALNGGDFWAGAAGGAVTGLVAGAAVDIAATAVVSGGATVIIGSALLSFAGGFFGSVGGQITTRAIEGKPVTLKSINLGDAIETGVYNTISFGIAGSLKYVSSGAKKYSSAKEFLKNLFSGWNKVNSMDVVGMDASTKIATVQTITNTYRNNNHYTAHKPR